MTVVRFLQTKPLSNERQEDNGVKGIRAKQVGLVAAFYFNDYADLLCIADFARIGRIRRRIGGNVFKHTVSG